MLMHYVNISIVHKRIVKHSFVISDKALVYAMANK